MTAQHLKAAQFSTETQSVHARKVQSIRNFVLDRPKALNALNLEMIYTMTPQLQVIVFD
jgi:enoyl-CoA hydratase/carnithine racemase